MTRWLPSIIHHGLFSFAIRLALAAHISLLLL